MPDSVLKLTEGNGKMVKLKQLRSEFFLSVDLRGKKFRFRVRVTKKKL